MEQTYVQQLLKFLKASPSCYHAAYAVAKELEDNGYQQLQEFEPWQLREGGKYFVMRSDASVIAFRIPKRNFRGFMLAAAHMGDSDGFWEGYDLFKPSHTVDEDWSVIYESSNIPDAYPYTTNEMLLCRAILDGIVCDCWGDVRYNNVKFDNLKYKNLHLQDGTIISNWH